MKLLSHYTLIAALMGGMLVGCKADLPVTDQPLADAAPAAMKSSPSYFMVKDAIQDKVRIKLSEAAVSNLRGKDIQQLRSSNDEIAKLLRNIHAKRIVPVFEVGGKYEARQLVGGIGTEYVYNRALSARVGWYLEQHNSYPSLGLGYRYRMISLDAAYRISSAPMGRLFQIGLNVTL